eukprot:scaffold1906_cov106-Isochrysis_galbana.AAC.1
MKQGASCAPVVELSEPYFSLLKQKVQRSRPSAPARFVCNGSVDSGPLVAGGTGALILTSRSYELEQIHDEHVPCSLSLGAQGGNRVRSHPACPSASRREQ